MARHSIEVEAIQYCDLDYFGFTLDVGHLSTYYNCTSFFVLFFSADDDQEGVLDGLMEALNTGSAFRDPSRPARKKAPAGKKGEITDVTQSVTLHANRHAIAISLLDRLKGLISSLDNHINRTEGRCSFSSCRVRD